MKYGVSVLTVEDLNFEYDADSPILRGVDLHLERGAAVGLLGANGAGKSTLLGAITNSIYGSRRGAIRASDDNVGPIGYATQNPALYLHLSARENVVHAARLATRRWKVDRLVDETIDEYGLGSFVDQSARQLSGGQTRITHLACSFVHRPTVRLLDEPTTALDFETRHKLVELVHRWRGENIATLVTAHYPEDIEELCTDLVVLIDGRTHALGPIDSHLRSLGTTATIRGAEATHELQVVRPTLGALITAGADVGIDADTPLDSIRLSPPSLRDLLRRDPSLRSAVADAEPGVA